MTRTIEGLATTLAIVLLLFSPMLEPEVSLVAALALIVVLIAILNVHRHGAAPQA